MNKVINGKQVFKLDTPIKEINEWFENKYPSRVVSERMIFRGKQTMKLVYTVTIKL